MNFERAFERLLSHEGGYVDDRRDRGGKTKFGISQAAYPGEDIPNLTLTRAKELYLRDYWGPAGCDAVPDPLKFELFDMAVNSGPRTAVRCLQKAAGCPPDGILGPVTLQAIQSIPPVRLVARFNGHRLQYLAALTDWPAFGRGWANRVAANLQVA